MEWLRTVFEPETREKANGKPRLLIADGHDSHISGNFISHCMENNIDLLILPPHCSHILQPLDVSVFGPLKTAHGVETDTLTRTGISRTQKPEWVDLYLRARLKALTKKNVQSAWRGAGLLPWNPQRAYTQLPSRAPLAPTTPQNPSQFDSSLLKSSPPDGTELRDSNAALNQIVESQEALNTPTRKYISRLTRVSEVQNAELTMLRKELSEEEKVLMQQRSRKTGKRVVIGNAVVLSTEKIRLAVVEVEDHTRRKKAATQRRKRKQEEVFLEDEEDIIQKGSQTEDSDLEDCIVVAVVPK